MSYTNFDFPHTHFFDDDLRELLKKIFELNDEVKNFVSVNAIKFANPIQWSITSQYEKNTIVVDPETGTAYISIAPVPRGISLSNTDYWTDVFNLQTLLARIAQNFTNDYELTGTSFATFDTSENGWIVIGDVLYKATTDITTGDAYVVGGNIEHFNIEDVTGHLENLNTISKSNLVSAINEVLQKIINDITAEAEARSTTDTNLQGQITNNYNQLNNEIDTLEDKTLTGRYFVLIGDSLGMGTSRVSGVYIVGKGWIGHAMDVIGADHCVYATVDGGGFAEPEPYEWLYQLQNVTFPSNITDDMITDVVILGGTNDINHSIADVRDKIEEFCEYVKTRFHNLRNLRCGALCEPKFSNAVEERYKEIAKYGGVYIPDLENLLCDASKYDETGHVHLSQAGYTYFAPYVNEVILEGRTHYKFVLKVSGTTDLSIETGYSWDTGQGTPMITYIITKHFVKMILGGTNSSNGNSCYVQVPANKSTGFFTWTGLEPLVHDVSDSVYFRVAGGSKTTASKDGIIANSSFNTYLGQASFVAQNYSQNATGHNTIFIQFCTPNNSDAKRLIVNNAQIIVSDDTYTINPN